MSYNATIATPQKASISNYPQSKYLVLPGSNHAVSFTDDAKTDKRKMRRHVAVYAQIHKQYPLDWYYDIIKICQGQPGELKATSLKVFRLMPQPKRRKLWDTLRLVQINISDPLPYARDTNEIIQRVTNKKVSIEKLREKAQARDPVAQKMVEMFNNQTAERILMDSTSKRLEFIMYYIDNPMARLLNPNPSFVPPPPAFRFDVAKFRSKNPGSIVRSVVEYSAKEASAFSEALDITMKGRYRGQYHPINPVYSSLQKAHAFDRGNEASIEIMEEQRRKLVSRMRDHQYLVGDNYGLQPLEGRIESSNSYLMQASDTAGRIATYLLENESLFVIAKSFDHVVYNGKRLREERAFQISQEYKKLGY